VSMGKTRARHQSLEQGGYQNQLIQGGHSAEWSDKVLNLQVSALNWMCAICMPEYQPLLTQQDNQFCKLYVITITTSFILKVHGQV